MSRERRQRRKRMYSLVALLLTTIIGIVAMSALLQLGGQRIDERVYAHPHRTLGALAQAQRRFRRRDLDKDGLKDFARSLEEMEAAGCITAKLASGEVRGYRYAVTADEQGRRFAISATPAVVTTSTLFYWVDQTQVVRASREGPAGEQSAVYWHPLRGFQWMDAAPDFEESLR